MLIPFIFVLFLLCNQKRLVLVKIYSTHPHYRLQVREILSRTGSKIKAQGLQEENKPRCHTQQLIS